MSRNNNVFQVLVAETVLAVDGKSPASLQPEQLGIFDADTNVSVTNPKAGSPFYLALKTREGELLKSAGNSIDPKKVVDYTVKPYSAAVPQEFVISGIKANCDTEYGVKIGIKNQQTYNRQGHLTLNKSYYVTTPCCADDCKPCTPQDGNELVKLLLTAINSDGEFFKAEAIHPTKKTVIADIDAFIKANKTVNTDANTTNDVVADIKITAIPVPTVGTQGINLKYLLNRNTNMEVTLVGFECGAKVEKTKEATIEEGNGYDIQELEYQCMGWEGSTYRNSDLTGMSNNRPYMAIANKHYDSLILSYEQSLVAGFLTHTHQLTTLVYFSVDASTAFNTFKGKVDTLLGVAIPKPVA